MGDVVQPVLWFSIKVNLTTKIQHYEKNFTIYISIITFSNNVRTKQNKFN